MVKKVVLVFSLGVNAILAGALFWVNERYGLWAKVQRVWLEEGRVPGLSSRHELNRNYQTRRELFRLDRNKDAKILFIGDSQVSLADWNAMLGAPIVANRGIEGDTTTGVLARLSDDEHFTGDTIVLWIGTNDVLQGEDADDIAARIIAAAQQMAEMLKSGKAEMLKKAGTYGKAEGGERQAEMLKNGNAEMLKKSGKRKVIVFGVAPVAGWVERAAERNSVVAEVNRRLTAAAPVDGFTFIDLGPVLADGSGYLRGEMTSDGIHLGAAAYRVIVGKLEDAALKR